MLAGEAAWAELTIGVMSIQGAFAEHIKMFERLGVGSVREVRTAKDFEGIDGLALPGGESTAMVLIAKPDEKTGGEHVAAVAAEAGIIEALHAWVRERQMPTWGTCAGLILLSNGLASGTTKIGGCVPTMPVWYMRSPES
jgi:5'-phosphate synthase pdxT subunit